MTLLDVVLTCVAERWKVSGQSGGTPRSTRGKFQQNVGSFLKDSFDITLVDPWSTLESCGTIFEQFRNFEPRHVRRRGRGVSGRMSNGMGIPI